MTGFAGAVLAGGASRRMGADKATLVLGGGILAARPYEALRSAGADPVMVVGGDARRLQEHALTVVADRWPGEGPLGGIVTALGTVGGGVHPVMVLSCDLPDASAEAVSTVAETAAGHQGAVVVPIVDGRRQWMHAWWPPEALGPLHAAFTAGERAPHRAVAGLTVVEVVMSDAGPFVDVDRPADLPGTGGSLDDR